MTEAKQPPQDIYAERSILGAIMLEPDCLDKVLTAIKDPDVFYEEKNKVIFSAIVDLHKSGKNIDFISVISTLRDSKDLENIGGSFYITKLTQDIVSSAHIETWCEIVVDKHKRRILARLALEYYNQSFDEENGLNSTLESLKRKLEGLDSISTQIEFKNIGEVMDMSVAESVANNEKKSELIGDSTGIKGLDDMIGGTIDSDYVILAAGTGEGKSTLALQIAEHTAHTLKIPTMFYSLEMKDKQLGHKVLSQNVNKSVKDLRLGKLNESEFETLIGVKSSHKDTPLYIYDKPIMIDDLIRSIRYMVRVYKVKKVIVDYLQLVKPSDSMLRGNREQIVSNISKELRSVALELDVCIIALSQLAEMEKGVSRMYRMGDLRESKSIGHDATTVLMIWKPNLKSQQRFNATIMLGKEEVITDDKDAILLVLKNRLDNTGYVRLKDDWQNSKFIEFGSEPPQHESYKISRDLSKPLDIEIPY